jgi:hypothetical protein
MVGEGEPKKAEASDVKLKIVPLPKIVFFYPTALVALICGVLMSIYGGSAANPMNFYDPPKTAIFAGWFFMAFFTANVMIISFDFPGVKFLAVLFAGIAMILGVALTSIYYPDLLPFVGEIFGKIKPIAVPSFYYCVATILWLTIIAGWQIAGITDVWYLDSNELVHKRGILGDVEKYPTLNLRVTKEITDLFEFLLLMSGSLVLQPTTTDRPIVLENVININHKEKRIRELLSKWKVGS